MITFPIFQSGSTFYRPAVRVLIKEGLFSVDRAGLALSPSIFQLFLDQRRRIQPLISLIRPSPAFCSAGSPCISQIKSKCLFTDFPEGSPIKSQNDFENAGKH